MSLTDNCQDTLSITRASPASDAVANDPAAVVVNDPSGNPLTAFPCCIQTPSTREYLKFGVSATELTDVAYTESDVSGVRKDDSATNQNGQKYLILHGQDMGGQKLAFAVYMKRLG